MDFYDWLEAILPARPIIFEMFSVNDADLLLVHLENQPQMTNDDVHFARFYYCDYLSPFDDVMLWVNPADEFGLWMAINGKQIESSYRDFTGPKLARIWSNLVSRKLV